MRARRRKLEGLLGKGHEIGLACSCFGCRPLCERIWKLPVVIIITNRTLVFFVLLLMITMCLRLQLLRSFEQLQKLKMESLESKWQCVDPIGRAIAINV